MNKGIQSIFLKPAHTIKDAMERMERSPKRFGPNAPWGICVITDKQHTLLGVITDGDIRRAILDGRPMTEPISSIMTKNPLKIQSASRPQDMMVALFHELKKRNAHESKYHHIVIVNEKNIVEDVVTPFELWRRSEVKTRHVAIFGLGYVGLTLALSFNELGIKVSGIDTNQSVINKLKRGVPHFYEKGLGILLKRHINKNLFVKKTLAKNESDVYVICVGTEVNANNKMISTDLKNAAHAVGRALKSHDLVILRSTVVVGTTRNTVIPILEKQSGLEAGKDFFVAFAPERTAQGKALEELRTLPQIIGGHTKQGLDYASQLFQPLTNTIVTVSSVEAAETVKLLNNTFRDVSFSFANEVAQMCDRMNLNATEVIRAANEGYPRNTIPHPSPGVGGSCLVKDPHIFVESGKKAGYYAKLPILARTINKSMVDFTYKKTHSFLRRYKKNPNASKIFIMGMTFKGHPETSDLRHSTPVDIAKKLQRTYKNIVVYDPIAKKHELKKLGVRVASSPKSGFKDADCVLILNNHPAYKNMNVRMFAKSMKNPGLLLDTWNIYSPQQLSDLMHVSYEGLGVEKKYPTT